MKVNGFFLPVLGGIMLTGCSALGGKTDIDRLSKANVSVVSYEAESRGAYFAHEGKAVKYCAEPPPDVALNRSLEVAGSLASQVQGAEGTASANAKLASTAVELAGRTQLVLLARELLYRTCELSLNGQISSDQVAENYQQVVALIGQLGAAELVQELSTLSESGMDQSSLNLLLEGL